MRDLLPYLCPFADCDLKNRMWDVRLEWETHLNEQHPFPTAQGRETQRYAFTCKICLRTFMIDDHSREEEFRNPACQFRNSHYAEHMERIASSVVNDYGPRRPDLSWTRDPKKHFKRRRRRKRRAGSTSGHDSSFSGRDEEAISGWSSEGSTGSRG